MDEGDHGDGSWLVDENGIIDEIADQDEYVRTEFFECLSYLSQDPSPSDYGGVQPFITTLAGSESFGVPAGFVIPFDDGLLAYQVMTSETGETLRIALLRVIWLPE